MASQPTPWVGDEQGLAGAEQRLINLNMNAGQLEVQRQILQMRVDFLLQLNTQTMLIAGVGVGMLSSLELEAIQGESGEAESWFHSLRLMLYVGGASISLGCSVWVLYTSNNLINLATMSALHATQLDHVQGADNILGLRMRDVRRMYVLALLTVLPSLYVMVVHLIEWYAAWPACAAVTALVIHAIHADHATSYHFERSTGIIVHDSSLEHSVRHATKKCFECLEPGPGGGYEQLGLRLKRRLQLVKIASRVEASEAPPEQRMGARLARGLLRRGLSRDDGGLGAWTDGLQTPNSRLRHVVADATVRSGYLLKTPSSKGPTAVLHSLALGAQTASARSELLLSTPANSPASRRWWVLRGVSLSCFSSSEEWEAGVQPKLVVPLQKYAVLEVLDAQATPTIALIPKDEIRAGRAPVDATHVPSAGADGDAGLKSWYLQACPPTERGETARWYKWLSDACTLRRRVTVPAPPQREPSTR